MNYILKFLFFTPASLLYGTVMMLRNKCYDWKIFDSVDFSIPVIVVGNITVGGTGKTPHTEKILSLINNECRLAVLSRGYKRKTRGFYRVECTDNSRNVGDEPLQIKQKYPNVTVVVDANRVNGIYRLMADVDKYEMIILDDAFQHRKLIPSLAILLIDYNHPICDDFMLPLGRLRDNKNQYRRADVVIVTKCPPKLTPIEQRILAKDMRLLPYQQLYMTSFIYGDATAVFEDEGYTDNGYNLQLSRQSSIVITGIADPSQFFAYLTEQGYTVQLRLSFPDHHAFTVRDVKQINDMAQKYPAIPIFTTEKDAIRLREAGNLTSDVKHRLLYIPVTVQFLTSDGEQNFKKRILKKNK